ncbi:hypothetical protein KPL44_00920 [Clostridium sp. DSM 17811]|nr:hypothetical protein [Clostridium sp. DSM 17811]
MPSGTHVKSGHVIVHVQAKADDYHMGWKVSMNIIEIL